MYLRLFSVYFNRIIWALYKVAMIKLKGADECMEMTYAIKNSAPLLFYSILFGCLSNCLNKLKIIIHNKNTNFKVKCQTLFIVKIYDIDYLL